MRNHLWPVALAGALGAACLTGLALWSRSTQADDAPPAQPGTASLRLTHAHLLTSGVGFFQREGVVEGNATVNLTVPAADVSDVLKSLVLEDLDGGRISAAAYDGQDPAERTLRGFSVNLSGNPSYAQILNQMRGEKVEVVLLAGAAQPGTLTGAVLGVERQKVAAGKDAVEADVLNLWCADGMRGVKLADVQRVRFLNPAVDADFRQALDVLTRTHDTSRRSITLNFVGQGKRRVRVGYVVESPMWKTSYRLTIGKDGKPTLQGWATVDNPTDEDWTDVRIALVAGRPLSFKMDLDKPVYVPRPKVEWQLFAGLRPPTHDAPMNWMEAQREALARKVAATGGPGPRPAVRAEAVGEFFQYVPEHPVSLPRQKSALFPILEQEVEGTPVSLWNEANGLRQPLLGLRFKNSTGLHLAQGPVTVYADGGYTGDAMMPDLQPGEERLITCTVDLGTEVSSHATPPAESVVTVRVDKGILHATAKVRETRTYTARNRAPKDRLVLIEHPYRPEFTLVSPEPDDVRDPERTRDLYRFEVRVRAGKTETLEVVEERTIVQQVILTNADDQTVLRYLSNAKPSPALREALAKAGELKGRLEATRREIARQEKQHKAVVDDQARLRANLERVPPGSEAYKRYLKKFDEQEVEIEKLQDAIKKLQDAEFEQRQAYETFLANLSVE